MLRSKKAIQCATLINMLFNGPALVKIVA